MTRLAAPHLALACLLIGAIAGSEIAAWPSPVAPATDPFGTCTPEAALDDPATWAGGKGARLPHTCMFPDDRPTPAALADAYGRPLSEDEYSARLYMWLLAAGESPFRPVDDPTSPVPLPGAVWLMLAGAGALAAVKWRTAWAQ